MTGQPGPDGYNAALERTRLGEIADEGFKPVSRQEVSLLAGDQDSVELKVEDREDRLEHMLALHGFRRLISE